MAEEEFSPMANFYVHLSSDAWDKQRSMPREKQDALRESYMALNFGPEKLGAVPDANTENRYTVRIGEDIEIKFEVMPQSGSIRIHEITWPAEIVGGF